jgi:hypothetical protein
MVDNTNEDTTMSVRELAYRLLQLPQDVQDLPISVYDECEYESGVRESFISVYKDGDSMWRDQSTETRRAHVSITCN